MYISDCVLDLLIFDIYNEYLRYESAIGRAFDNPIADDHTIGEIVLINPSNLDIDKKLLEIPSVQRSKV